VCIDDDPPFVDYRGGSRREGVRKGGREGYLTTGCIYLLDTISLFLGGGGRGEHFWGGRREGGKEDVVSGEGFPVDVGGGREGGEEEEEGHARGCIHFHRGYFFIIESGTVCFYIFFFYFVEQQQRD